MMLQKISVLNKWCYIELSIHQRSMKRKFTQTYEAAQLFNNQKSAY